MTRLEGIRARQARERARRARREQRALGVLLAVMVLVGMCAR